MGEEESRLGKESLVEERRSETNRGCISREAEPS